MDIKQIGSTIRRLREEAGLTQEDLSGHAKISNISLQRIEAGRGNPTIETISKIADHLGVKLWQLLQPTEQRPEAAGGNGAKNPKARSPVFIEGVSSDDHRGNKESKKDQAGHARDKQHSAFGDRDRGEVLSKTGAVNSETTGYHQESGDKADHKQSEDREHRPQIEDPAKDVHELINVHTLSSEIADQVFNRLKSEIDALKAELAAKNEAKIAANLSKPDKDLSPEQRELIGLIQVLETDDVGVLLEDARRLHAHGLNEGKSSDRRSR